MTKDEVTSGEEFSIEKNHDGSHFMSPSDVKRFDTLYKEGKHEAALTFLRTAWSLSADKEFLQKFYLVHWVDGAKSIVSFLSNQDSATEISCQAYRQPPFKNGWLSGGVGVLIEGMVNLAGNKDLQTNQWSGFTEKTGKKYTEYANRLCTSEENCTTPFEFVIGDWKPVAIVVATSADIQLQDLKSVIETFNLPVLNENGEKV